MVRYLILMLGLLLSACATPRQAVQSVQSESREPVTILVSIDGFRPIYLDRGVTPNLNALAQAGVMADMHPSFPSKTFPNHYTLVTGLRPDKNGIVGNSMEDPARPGVKFNMGNLDPFWWDGAEPIWISAEKQGVRTATMFWPGSEVPFHGQRPSDWTLYDPGISDDQRVAKILEWVQRPAATRPRFLTLYFSAVDSAGHRNGPDAPETTDAVAEVDGKIGKLVAGLKAIGQPANIMIVSDHGMATTSSDRVILLDAVVNLASIRLIGDGPYAEIEPVAGHETEAEAALLRPHPNMDCWRKGEIPTRFAYGKNPRVPPILCLARTGWLIADTTPKWNVNGGAHGYDNMASEMTAIFIGNGPAFRGGVTLKPIDNVDVYPMLAGLIGVAPLANDGHAGVWADALTQR